MRLHDNMSSGNGYKVRLLDAAVRWLESENAIEAAELTRNVIGGKFYLVTAHGVELVRLDRG